MTRPESDSDDDGAPVLTDATATALREFLAEAEQRAKKARESANAANGCDDDDDPDSLFSEDWGLSQFWYTDETATDVAGAVIKAAQERVVLCEDAEEEETRRRRAGAGASASAAASPPPRRLPRIACIACPSLFRALRSTPQFLEAAEAHLFEFDDRFAKLGGGFSHYDYRRPRRIDPELLGFFDAVVADPPYLSAECLRKTAVTMRLLGAAGGGGGDREKEKKETKGESSSGGANDSSRREDRSSSSTSALPPPVLVLLSGAVQRHRAHAFLGMLPVTWRPQHRNKLGNEFLLMTSSEGVARELGGFDEELPIDPVEDDELKSEDDDGDEEEE